MTRSPRRYKAGLEIANDGRRPGSSYRRLAREGKGRRHISDQLAEAADRLSSMADKVAGFAISSSLLLTFACLKDIGDWVKHQPWQFAVGTFVAGIYVAAVLWLYFQELQVRAMSNLSTDQLAGVHRSLMLARCLGIALFTAIGIAAVFGASRGP